ncbi:MAG: alpha/beta fold hydrolase [Gammaproteobacteria bacterium]|nr:alpha/beta fold hydrolase [Gammaproteobacteria bacterium]
MSPADSLIQEPADGPARSALVWLHGLGATADDFAELGRQLQCPGLRVIALQARPRPVTIFGGQVAPSWFDILPEPDGRVTSNIDELEESARHVRAEFERQRESGITQLAVGGFSQGGAQALFTTLTHPEPLAAAVCLSGYLPQDKYLMRQVGRLTLQTPVFMAHGSQDDVVLHEYGEVSCNWLRGHGASVDWYSEAFAHTIIPEEIAALGEFLRSNLD